MSLQDFVSLEVTTINVIRICNSSITVVRLQNNAAFCQSFRMIKSI